jgi:hypothetical protein
MSGTTRRIAAKAPPQTFRLIAIKLRSDLMLRSIAARTERKRFYGLGCAAIRLEA